MASFSLDIRNMEHFGQVEDVSVKMNSVHSIGHIARKAREVRVANVFFDLDVLKRKPGDLGADPLRSLVFVPTASSHSCSLLPKAAVWYFLKMVGQHGSARLRGCALPFVEKIQNKILHVERASLQ